MLTGASRPKHAGGLTMRWITRRFLTRAGAVALGLWLSGGASALAQIPTTGGGGGGGISIGGGGGIGGGGLTGGGGAGGGGLQPPPGMGGGGGPGGAGGSGAGGGLGGTGGAGAAGRTGGAGTSVDQSNFLSSYYSNPLYMGRPNQTATTPGAAGANGVTSIGSTQARGVSGTSGLGGFGQPSFGASQGAGRTTGRAGTATATTNRAGALGSGLGGTGLQQGGSTTRLTYATSVRFPVRPVVTSELTSELRGVINRSSSLKNPGAIEVIVDGQTVVLRGKVSDEDESRLVEGLIMLTPGVRQVKNELQLP